MIIIKKINTNEEFEDAITSLTEIFIDEYPYYETWIRKNITQFELGEKQILSINSDDELCGYLMIHFCRKNIVKINGIYVFEDYKGKGIASVAIQELTTLLKNNGVDLVFVQTRLENNAVVHLFDKTGYNLIGTNYHKVEMKDNWVACNDLTGEIPNIFEIAYNIYDGYNYLSDEQINKIKDKYKDANLVLSKTKKKK
jgi:ribosomal protein S18 acetylase RimI-like enzyme